MAFERSGTFLYRIERIVAPASLPAPDGVEDVGVSDDDDTEREIETVVAAGDESRDGAGTFAAGLELMASGEVQPPVRLTVQRSAKGGLIIEAPPETASTLAALFARMAPVLQAAATPRGTGGGPVG